MSQRPPEVVRPGDRRSGCDLCTYGVIRWVVCFSWPHELWELEREVCDRCVEQLAQAGREGFAEVWWIEEA